MALSQQSPLKTVYDFGMYNGNDVDYYVKKGYRVIGVEANTLLVNECKARFQHEIADGRVVLLNLALSNESSDEPISFYIHKVQRVLSQVVRPSDETLA